MATNDHDLSLEALELRDWLDSLDELLHLRGKDRVVRVLKALQIHAQRAGVELPVTSKTPYVNTIALDRQPPFPGDRAIERRIKSLVRWNAMAMVVRANKESPGIGGHISSYASAATLYEVGFNHFFRGPNHDSTGDLVFFQGHSAPGVYARAFLEGRLPEERLKNFRRELSGGVASYPHPWLMPDFWQVPTVSMGLGPIMAIYQARFMRYLSDRGHKAYRGAKVFAFLGDGETDEPEALGAISLAAREKLDNLVFVINCNLQRLDGPVRGNGKIVQELEANFRGSGWNVIKTLWGGDWDPLLARDKDGLLAQRMADVVDGESQKYAVEGGAYIRQHFWGVDPRLADMVRHLPDEALWKMNLGGHDPDKVYAAFKAATEHRDQPTVILARTIKGYGLGEAGEGKNITHSQKKLNEEELFHFRDRFDIPLTDAQVKEMPFYRPAENSPELVYLRERRRALGGPVPARSQHVVKLPQPPLSTYQEFLDGTKGRPVSTTMAFVRLLNQVLRDPKIGRLVVPIVPDEARTFGMEGMFRQYGIYSHVGQLYEPVDADQLMYYREAKEGQVLEEGISEAGSMSSFIAAGTAYSLHGVPTIPFFILYSMFGLQRIGDLAWAAGDMRCRGFLVGGTAGRTTLNGEGLQHQDGHSHVLASTIPTLRAYDPAFAFELALIVRDGLRRMYEENEDGYYYLTVGNENYPQPPMPEGVEAGVVAGLYRFRASPLKDATARVQLFGSGALMNGALEAAERLEDAYGIAADVWSVTSYTELRRDALDCERHNRLHPEETPQIPYVTRALAGVSGPFIAVSDYMKILADGLAPFIPGLISLGTDGFGRSDTREALRDFFEVDARHVTLAALTALAKGGKYPSEALAQAVRDLGIDPTKLNPARS